LKSLFEAAYLKHDNLADATRQCEFTFGTYGLVILDADDADLKRLLFLLQKNYYTKLPIKQYLKQPKIKKVQHTGKPAKSICFISKIK
jgi:hypothetical protein